MPAIIFPTGVFLARTTALPLSGGKVYIGAADLDPSVLGNRINVTVVNENGTETIIAPAQQPLILSIGGMMNYPYNTGGVGSVVQMKVSSQFSCKVFDENDVQQYYFPRAVVNDASFVGDVVIDGDTTINGDITIVGGAYIGYQREAVLNIESVDGSLEIDCQAAAYFVTTFTENVVISFSNPPSVTDGYGQTWMMTVYDVGNYSALFDSPPYQIQVRAVDNPPTYDVDSKAHIIFTCNEPEIIFFVPLKNVEDVD